MVELVDLASRSKDDPDDPSSVPGILKMLQAEYEAGNINSIAACCSGRAPDGTPATFSCYSKTNSFAEMTGVIAQLQHDRLMGAYTDRPRPPEE